MQIPSSYPFLASLVREGEGGRECVCECKSSRFLHLLAPSESRARKEA